MSIAFGVIVLATVVVVAAKPTSVSPFNHMPEVSFRRMATHDDANGGCVGECSLASDLAPQYVSQEMHFGDPVDELHNAQFRFVQPWAYKRQDRQYD